MTKQQTLDVISTALDHGGNTRITFHCGSKLEAFKLMRKLGISAYSRNEFEDVKWFKAPYDEVEITIIYDSKEVALSEMPF